MTWLNLSQHYLTELPREINNSCPSCPKLGTLMVKRTMKEILVFPKPSRKLNSRPLWLLSLCSPISPRPMSSHFEQGQSVNGKFLEPDRTLDASGITYFTQANLIIGLTSKIQSRPPLCPCPLAPMPPRLPQAGNRYRGHYRALC